MNILIISEFFPSSDKKITGGIENRVYNISKRLSLKHNVYAYTSMQPGCRRYEEVDGIKIFRYGPVFPYSSTGNLFKRSMWGIFLSLKIPSLIKKHKIDVIDSQSNFSYPCSLVAKIFKRQVYVTYHEVWLGSWIKNTGTWLGFLGELCEKVILFKLAILSVYIFSVSEFTKKKLINYGINERNITVIPNGIDVKSYRKGNVKRNKNAICYIGRLVSHKRVDDLIKAFSISRKKYPELKLIIAGDGPDKEKLIGLAKELKLDGAVEFKGYVKEHGDVVKLIKSSYLLVHPGTVEGFGIILIEAMASGTPYVASDIDVFKEVTEDGKGGLLFNAMNPDDLAEKIAELMENKKLYLNKQNEAKELAKKYEWDRIVERVEERYGK